jgi:hypothetical protein
MLQPTHDDAPYLDLLIHVRLDILAQIGNLTKGLNIQQSCCLLD